MGLLILFLILFISSLLGKCVSAFDFVYLTDIEYSGLTFIQCRVCAILFVFIL